MASVLYHIANLLKKMTSTDKDFRLMATNNLMAELQKDSIKLDDDSERKVVKMLLKLLEDKNGEVRNLAVKCLGPLVSKVKEFQVETIVETLFGYMNSDKKQLRDISKIGLKTVISELPPSFTTLAANISKKITTRLTNAILKQEEVSVQLEASGNHGDLLSRFGGHLVMSFSTSQFHELIEFLLTELTNNSSASTARTIIQCVGSISRQAGGRFGEYLEKMVPLIVDFCKTDDDELTKFCLQAFESFVRRCPKEVSSFIPDIIIICLKNICHDPNYNYDDVEDEYMETDTEDEDDDEESEDEYSDDDDMSWKVRRSAAKCLEAVVSTRHDMLAEFYKTVSPSLITRFKEREENVKSDIFHAYIALLKQTKPVVVASDDNEQEKGPLKMLQQQIPDIVKAVHPLLKEKSIKTRQGCFSLLTELVLVLPGALDQHLSSLMPGIQYSLGDKNSSSNMKIDTLAFLNTLLSNHNHQVFHPHIKALVPDDDHERGKDKERERKTIREREQQRKQEEKRHRERMERLREQSKRELKRDTERVRDRDRDRVSTRASRSRSHSPSPISSRSRKRSRSREMTSRYRSRERSSTPDSSQSVSSGAENRRHKRHNRCNCCNCACQCSCSFCAKRHSSSPRGPTTVRSFIRAVELASSISECALCQRGLSILTDKDSEIDSKKKDTDAKHQQKEHRRGRDPVCKIL